MAPSTTPNPLEYETFCSVRNFSALDGLRCLAVVAVVWHHSANVPSITKYFPASRFGFLGVDLFFEISGFLITVLLLREQSENGGISLKNFYIRRALRIFPLYYGILIAFSILYFYIRPDGSGAEAFKKEILIIATYMSNWIPVSGIFAITWSLAVEEQFYLVWPLIEKRARKAAVPIILLVIAASQLIQLGLLDEYLMSWFGWEATEPWFLRETTFTPIALGVLLAHLMSNRAGHKMLTTWFGSRKAAPLALFIIVVVCTLLPDDIRGISRPAIQLLLVIFLASCIVREDNGLACLLKNSILARIGVLSYGIYLLHHVALWIASKTLEAMSITALPQVLFLSGLGISILLSEISYRFYEKPFLRLRDDFRNTRQEIRKMAIEN